MNIKKILLYLSAAVLCGVLASCSTAKNDTVKVISETETTEPVSEETTAEPQAVPIEKTELEKTVSAKSGDAYLAISDSQGWIQYWGRKDSMLAYSAGVANITGNGTYTVSVTADTNGFRYETTENADDDSVVPSGIMFSAVMIKDGNTLFPNAVITIDSVKADGKEIKMTAKNYTSSDDGNELRSNIFNTWVEKLPTDAYSSEGALVVKGEPTESAEKYSPVIVDEDDFSSWREVAVTFTVSGIE